MLYSMRNLFCFERHYYNLARSKGIILHRKMTFTLGRFQSNTVTEKEHDTNLEDPYLDISLKNEHSAQCQTISQTQVLTLYCVATEADSEVKETTPIIHCPPPNSQPQQSLSLEPLQNQEAVDNWLTDNYQVASSPVKVFACNVCSYKIEKLFNFRLHMAQHSTDSETLIPVGIDHYKLRCGICGYFGTDHQDLEQHVEDHAYQKRFLCGYCDLDFQKKKEVRKHIWKTHKKAKVFYDRQILYRLMARQPLMMVRMYPIVLVDSKEVDAYFSNHSCSS